MNLFESIDKFVRDVTGTEFIKETLSSDFESITELKEAHETIIDIIKSQRRPSPRELTKYIYPLLDISSQWNTLDSSGKITPQFRKHCKRLFEKQCDFYGTGFEIEMAERAILSGWDVEFPEDYVKKLGKKPIDLLVTKNDPKSTVIGIECRSKRCTEDLSIEKIMEDIPIKAEKFKPDNLSELRKSPDVKVLLFDITRNGYSKPNFLRDLKQVEKCKEVTDKELNGIVFSWKEAAKEGNDDTITVKYEIFGDINKIYFSVTSKTHMSDSYYFVRKYVEPEPQWGTPGKMESCVEWVLAKQGGKLTLNELIRLTKMTPADLDVMLRDLELSGKIIREGRRISLKK